MGHVARRLLLLFGVVSLAAVALGAWVAQASGVPSALWVRNLIAWAVGAVLATGLATGYRTGWLPVVVWVGPVALAASFLSADVQGVHRWIDAGPLHMNAAMLFLPLTMVAFAASAADRRAPWIAAAVSLALLVAQPDASQATALAAVIALVAWRTVRPMRLGLGSLAAVAVMAVAAWMRPDPLPPVPEVEGIIGLAAAISPLAAVLAWALLAAVAAAPACAGRAIAGSALGLGLLLWALTTLAGAFPVPFIGIGLSPILGGWLGVGLLAGTIRPQAAR